MRRAWIVKTTDDGVPVPGIYESATKGLARIGWSSTDELNLRLFNSTPSHALTDDQKKASRCRRFLTDITRDDLLVYPRQPDYARFFVCQVVGDYDYLPAHLSLDGDFRSARKCDVVLQPMTIDDPRVPQLLAARMRLPGRLNELYDLQLLEDLIDRINAGVTEDPPSARIRRRMRKEILTSIRAEYPNKVFTTTLLPALFRALGHENIDIQEGAGEAGSDVVVSIASPLLPRELRIGVQGFAYEGEVASAELARKLEQLLRGWTANQLDFGLLLTTGDCSKTRWLVDKHNKDNASQLVQLMDAVELADLVLEHFESLTIIRPTEQA